MDYYTHSLTAKNLYRNGGRPEYVWYYLLKAEEAFSERKNKDYKEPTARQKEVQRLWQQRGLLERTKANLQICQDLILKEGFPEEAKILYKAQRIILARIAININQAASVKERIPSDLS